MSEERLLLSPICGGERSMRTLICSTDESFGSDPRTASGNELKKLLPVLPVPLLPASAMLAELRRR